MVCTLRITHAHKKHFCWRIFEGGEPLSSHYSIPRHVHSLQEHCDTKNCCRLCIILCKQISRNKVVFVNVHCLYLFPFSLFRSLQTDENLEEKRSLQKRNFGILHVANLPHIVHFHNGVNVRVFSLQCHQKNSEMQHSAF